MHCLFPQYWLHDLFLELFANMFGASISLAINVGVDGDDGRFYGDRLQGSADGVLSAGHEGRVEGTADGERFDLPEVE